MKKTSSILIIFVIVIIAFFAVWKASTPNLISKNKENTTEKISKKVKKESKKIKKKETSESESRSSSVKSEVSNMSSGESTSDVQPSVKYPVLQRYAGKTYYAVNRDSVEFPDMFPTSFTITSDTTSITIDGKQELIRDVSSGDSGFIALTGEMGHIMGTGLSFEFRPLGDGNDDAVEVINQGQYLDYSTTMSE
ncbi:hypothetical protein [Ligilactobacillus salivarius]|jgi:hypothetical protein|uniref:Uncharacterized protein n=1 Tax=Ligilactobacillus salivarius (strain UCC118) TaxID=362948 RepID=Q1WS30_LIGS1|nr:hypothetical protein [Ligilactobacillus salivarius]ABE00299.1 Hypothetical protein LSL_1495 [Ligilactobacillus salivarius UCC118]OQQ74390.1 hypothetical protein B6U64_08385 [Ligilactobacillus salivarius]OQR19263.1 hypothetical protein B6U40_07675 [Ligilactobacillus salivarius]